MLYGIGCDLCSLSHLEKSLSSAHAAAFVRRVYGPAEQAALGLLEGSAAPLNAHRLASAAADFAAKEAFLKAVGTGIGGGIALDEIAVEHLPGGAPVYRLTGAAQARLGELGAERAFLSLTHEAGMAAAVCVIE